MLQHVFGFISAKVVVYVFILKYVGNYEQNLFIFSFSSFCLKWWTVRIEDKGIVDTMRTTFFFPLFVSGTIPPIIINRGSGKIQLFLSPNLPQLHKKNLSARRVNNRKSSSSWNHRGRETWLLFVFKFMSRKIHVKSLFTKRKDSFI